MMASTIESKSMGGFITTLDNINFSVSKQKYSFSKGDRFPTVRKIATDAQYTLPSTKHKRSPGFGIGQRFKTPMELRRKSPDPGHYELKSDFDIGKPGTAHSTKRGIYSFGIGRENYKKVYLPEDPGQATDRGSIPGPGQYKSKLMTMGHEGQKWNMQGRSFNVRDPINIAIKKNVPAPGHYGQGIEINSVGKYPISTIQNTKAANWSPNKKRFDERRRTETPGPGVYNPSDYSGGLYLLSGNKNHGTHQMKPSFRMKRFKSVIKHQTPGPGAYQSPSDFGQFESYKSPRLMARSQMGMRSHHYSKFSTRGITQNSQREGRNKGSTISGGLDGGQSGYHTQSNSPNFADQNLSETRTVAKPKHSSRLAATIDYNTNIDLNNIPPMPLE